MTNVQRALTNRVGSVSPTSRYLFGIKLALLARLRDGESIVLHCKGGLGRTGMVAARLLVELGCMPEEAIVAVRSRFRIGVPGTAIGSPGDHSRGGTSG